LTIEHDRVGTGSEFLGHDGGGDQRNRGDRGCGVSKCVELAIGRDEVADALVRPLVIVDAAPGLEVVLHRGEIIELAQRYRDEGADELVFYVHHGQSRAALCRSAVDLEDRGLLDIPFCVAGGIRSVDTARRVLFAGADKVSINTPALERPQLIAEIAEAYGNQCVVVGIDSMEVLKQDLGIARRYPSLNKEALTKLEAIHKAKEQVLAVELHRAEPVVRQAEHHHVELADRRLAAGLDVQIVFSALVAATTQHAAVELDLVVGVLAVVLDELLDELRMEFREVPNLRLGPSQRPGSGHRARFLQYPGQSQWREAPVFSRRVAERSFETPALRQKIPQIDPNLSISARPRSAQSLFTRISCGVSTRMRVPSKVMSFVWQAAQVMPATGKDSTDWSGPTSAVGAGKGDMAMVSVLAGRQLIWCRTARKRQCRTYPS
ncbi:MAG: hypothetical protein HC783_14190, partial [Rhodobacteraceae bacterium]|nr:hypothetical protein [Paracoccaceae bacterium]